MQPIVTQTQEKKKQNEIYYNHISGNTNALLSK